MKNIIMIRGTTLNQPIKIHNYEESKAGDIFRFCVKKNVDDSQYSINKEITVATTGAKIDTFQLKLEPKDTLHLTPGDYMYEFALQTVDDNGVGEYYVLIPATPFIIKPNLTKFVAVENNG